jgi:SAM-dependent methyltransferase
MSLPFALPPVELGGENPIWNGDGFLVGEQRIPILEYGFNNSGWTDALTSFHEDTAGDNHFIDNASRQYALQQVQQHIPNKSGVVLEVGCSSGFMLDLMRKALPNVVVIGADVVRAPLLKLSADLPNTPLLRFSLVDCPLPDNSIDAVVMLNVLEHIEDDIGALRQVKRILKPGGVAVIEVPAGPHLYDVYDKILMHYRRYSLKELREKILAQGFQIKKQSHLGFFLYPGFQFVKRRNQRLTSETEALQKKAVEENIRQTKDNKLLDALMQIELQLGKWISYPIGIRCLMTCVKPE